MTGGVALDWVRLGAISDTRAGADERTRTADPSRRRHGLVAELRAAAGIPIAGKEVLKGEKLGGKTHQVHLDGYDKTVADRGR